MKFLGAHVSSEPSVAVAPEEAAAIGANAFAFNLVAPQSWSSPQYTEAEIAAFRTACERVGFSWRQILPHSAFVINLGGPDARKRAMSRRLFIDEMHRCNQLGLRLLNFHPGAHLGKISEDESLALIAENINRAHEAEPTVVAVLENTAGQGSNLGYDLAHLRRIIDLVEDKSRVGVCIDTCHAHAGCADLSTADGYDAFWDEFDSKIGFEYLRGMHLNDSVRAAGSRIDRHAPIGEGTIGAETFRRLMNDPRLDGIPLILETPDVDRWPEMIHALRKQEK